jgi:hypothetical protein
MPWSRILLGAVLDLLGTMWVLQGFSVLGGSPMTGVPFWAGAGLVLIVVGTVILVRSLRPTRPAGD